MAHINELTAKPDVRNLTHIDSLRSVLRTLQFNGVKGFKYKYEPDKSYTSIHDIINGNVAPGSVTRLSIHGAEFNRIPSIAYKCISLETLELVETRVRKLPHRLKKLKHLKNLHVYNNVSAKRLKLSKNDVIDFLRMRSSDGNLVPLDYRKLKKLDTLDLVRCNLKTFPDVSRNEKLTQLLLGENQLDLNDLHAIHNRNIQHLGLQRNRIDSVPSSITNFPALKKIVLNYNNISSISPAFATLNHLEELGLYSNKLKSIPSALLQLRGLQFLDLYYNEIERIPDGISNLENLNILYLASNRIYAVSDKLGELSNLRELYLHHNRISTMPATLANLHNLEIFRFNANRLVDVPDWITRLSKLKNIDFSQNNVHLTPEHLLQLQNLQIVAMTENPWEDVDKVEDMAEALVLRGVIVHLEARH